MRVFPLLAALSLAVGLVPTGSAQEQVTPELVVLFPNFGEEEYINLEPGYSTMDVPWEYNFPTQAGPPAGETTLQWSVACTPGDVSLSGETTTPVAFRPGQVQYKGTATLKIAASPETPGLTDLSCILTAVAAASPGVPETTDTIEFTPQVQPRLEIQVTVADASKQSGPQKQIGYPIEIVNLGNAKTRIDFEVLERPGGKWQLLLPDPVILEPGEVRTAIVMVATPYDNGYVTGSAGFRLGLRPSAATADGPIGEQQIIELESKVAGWYIPGPSPLFVIGLLAALVVARRRTLD